MALERIYSKYLYSFAREQNGFTKREAANILSAYWVCMTFGRFLGFPVAKCVHVKVIIFIEGIGNFICALGMYFLSYQNWMLWVWACLSGILIGPCHPSVIGWANRYMIVTGTGMAIMSLGPGISDITILPVVGRLIEGFGIFTMAVVVLGLGSVSCVLPFAMQSTACTRGDRFERVEGDEKDDDETPLLGQSNHIRLDE